MLVNYKNLFGINIDNTVTYNTLKTEKILKKITK